MYIPRSCGEAVFYALCLAWIFSPSSSYVHDHVKFRKNIDYPGRKIRQFLIYTGKKSKGIKSYQLPTHQKSIRVNNYQGRSHKISPAVLQILPPCPCLSAEACWQNSVSELSEKVLLVSQAKAMCFQQQPGPLNMSHTVRAPGRILMLNEQFVSQQERPE